MCSCGIDTPCYGGCPCGCKHTGPVDAKPTDVRSDYQRGLDAARDAVAAQLASYRTDSINDGKGVLWVVVDTFRVAIAVIDALRGESDE